MLFNTQMPVRSYRTLCPRFLHRNKGNAFSSTAPSQIAGVTVMPIFFSIARATFMPVPHFYHGLLKKPSSLLCQTASTFDKHLGEYCQRIEELELLLKNSERNTSNNGSFSLQSLPEVMANVHDIFIHVVTKVENSIHQHMNHMKSTCHVKHRPWQEQNDPSQVADQCETARKEIASKRVHPTLQLREDSQPSTELAGLFSSSGTAGPLTAPHTSPLTSNSSGSGFSVFSMPPSAPSSLLSSFSMTTTTFAPQSPLLWSSSATPQTSLLISSSSFLFCSTCSQFGSTAPLCGTTSGGSTSSTSFSLERKKVKILILLDADRSDLKL
ncbi:nuclear pore complex protein NUP58-like [Prosopis cineraria]|uniref:nuclear pore complex protein NUP58-like n=1 Tax=Prosopis cineraria TaxID=364024 RepID=UPI00240F6EA9|nr:nuclear pore complex protein NUP58-like [Prosopis cineraria]XP_054808228.1 nuclear pore complex protein NUP58-like [Prosopis cineraria]XP_054808229.1 nuclear pore complex protein NUP58-like [Prosopis cineraria]XP_054808230.1 nuclear pore complex protein NUP58-like [Prosopis cineraria]